MTGSLPITNSAPATRSTRRRNGGHGIRDVDLPQPRRSIPTDVLSLLFARWNLRQDRAKDDYYRKPLERR